MSGNILEMTNDECLKSIQDVAKNMNGYGDHNKKFDESKSVMDFVLDGIKNSSDNIANRLDASVKAFTRGDY